MTESLNPFTVRPNVDPYNGQSLPGFRIHGHCRHLAPDAVRVFVNAADAEALITRHVAKYHQSEGPK